jgi:hypothetical protein
MVRAAFSSTASSELKGIPVLFTPRLLPGRLVAHVLADEGEDERLGHALDREADVDVTDLERPAPVPTTAMPKRSGEAAARRGM